MDGKITISTEVDTKGIIEGTKEIDKILENQNFSEKLWEDNGEASELVSKNIEQTTDELELLYGKLEETASLYREMSQQKILSAEDVAYAQELRQQIVEIANQIYQKTGKMPLVKGITDVKQELPQINNGLSSVIKKVGRWSLMLLGIRSVYGLLSSTATSLSQQNDEMAMKLQAIRGSLTNLLAPAVEVIVNLVYRLLSYLNVITKTFLGIDLFAKSSKSAKSTVGSAQKLRKTLAGFDEMNILNDNVSGGGGGGGIKTPDIEPIDTSKFQLAVEKYKSMWNEILQIDRKEAKKLFLQSDDTWGYLKFGFFDYVQGAILGIQGFVDVFVGVFKIIKGTALGDTKLIKEGITQAIAGIGEIIRGLIQRILGISEIVTGLGAGLGTKIRKWFSSIGVDISKWISEQYKAIASSFTSIGTKVGEWVGESLKSIINSILTYINKKINGYIDNLNSAISVVNKLGLNVKKISHISLPKLAKGGIVNMPSRGVPIGGALAGEKGAEGVIPLTDSQQMELLGEAIGRYITINASITNTMNGRIISRELQKINNENSFASNN